MRAAVTARRAALAARGIARPDDEGGVTLEVILWIGGAAAMALIAIAAVVTKVTTATNNIPTGPSGP